MWYTIFSVPQATEEDCHNSKSWMGNSHQPKFFGYLWKRKGWVFIWCLIMHAWFRCTVKKQLLLARAERWMLREGILYFAIQFCLGSHIQFIRKTSDCCKTVISVPSVTSVWDISPLVFVFIVTSIELNLSLKINCLTAKIYIISQNVRFSHT
jgi:hypothetical protein